MFVVAGMPADEAAGDKRSGFAPIMDRPRFTADVPPNGVCRECETDEANKRCAPGTAKKRSEECFHVGCYFPTQPVFPEPDSLT